jgi:hypothetical protein
MRVETLRVLVYRETGEEWRARLSDHCPVSVRFAVPDRGGMAENRSAFGRLRRGDEPVR